MAFLYWYYVDAWKSVSRGVRNFIAFWWYYFSVPWLARTLIAPWRRDVVPYGRGFDIAQFFRTLAENLVSRGVGMAVRLGAIAACLTFEMATIALGGLYLLLWPLLIPALLALLYAGATLFWRTGTALALLLLLFALLAAPAIVIAFYRRRRLELIAAAADDLPSRFPDVWERILMRLGYEGAPADFPGARSAFLEQYGLTEDDVALVIRREVSRAWEYERRLRFWEAEQLFAVPPIGRSWVYGYTVRLDRIGRELTAAAFERRPDGFIPYAREVRAVEEVLSRAMEHNVLLVGQPGVGRHAVVEEFSRLIAQGRVANALAHKRVIELNLRAARQAEDLDAALNEAAYAGNVILVLPDIERYIAYGEVLLPYLRSNAIQVIGMTTYEALHETLEHAPEILQYMEKVEVAEPDAETTLGILFDLAPALESRYGVIAPYPTLKAIVERADRYIQDAPFPEKAIDLFDRVLGVAASRGARMVRVPLVDEVLSEKTEIPIAGPGETERELLLHLEERMHERLINQEEAVRQIANVLRRARVDIQDRARPVGSFLFLGPTGVGKTETAKALARLYYGAESRMLRFDMSEYQEAGGIARLIGDIATNTQGLLTTAVRENPASLLLFDEIEKAHPDILHLFLQLLDDARLTDAWGRTVKFAASLIIGTSNAGSELIREEVEAGNDPAQIKEHIIDGLLRRGAFRPEFVNRFDGVIVFHPLRQPELERIATLMLGDLAGRLAEQRITFTPTVELAREIVAKGYSPEFGARPMRRVIQDEIEAALAKQILAGTLAKGMAIAPKSLTDIS